MLGVEEEAVVVELLEVWVESVVIIAILLVVIVGLVNCFFRHRLALGGAVRVHKLKASGDEVLYRYEVTFLRHSDRQVAPEHIAHFSLVKWLLELGVVMGVVTAANSEALISCGDIGGREEVAEHDIVVEVVGQLVAIILTEGDSVQYIRLYVFDRYLEGEIAEDGFGIYIKLALLSPIVEYVEEIV